jgi:hypothetical protein
MKHDMKATRRQFLKIGSAALALIPVVALSGNAMAATNAGMRAAMKYQNKPNSGKHCAICMQFMPGKSAKALGGCKIFPGDTEISPNGYCNGFTPKA